MYTSRSPCSRAVLFVSHRTRRITLVERSKTGWDEREWRAGEDVSLAVPAVSFSVDEIYDRILLDPA